MWDQNKLRPPADRGRAVAVIIFVLGLGTLLPWNFFMMASQYFNQRLAAPPNSTSGGSTKDYNYDSWMALLSQLPLLLFTLLNSFLYQRVRERLRVAFSLIVILLLFCLTAALVQVPMQPDTFFSVTMATIWFINSGCNGSLPTGDKGRRKSRFALCRRNTANGVKPSTVHSPGTPQAAKAVSNKEQHSISYTLSRAQTVVVEYTQDSNTDMFQIGRSTETPIDFVVTDTLPGGHGHADGQTVQSTISRFACRIICQRNPPYAVWIYAAGFDSSKNIFLGEKAVKWRMQDGQMDGLTTNGVLVMHPRHGFSQGSKPGLWREMSVCGNVFTLRETRSSQQRGKMVGDSNRLFMGAVVLL